MSLFRVFCMPRSSRKHPNRAKAWAVAVIMTGSGEREAETSRANEKQEGSEEILGQR